MTHSSDMQKYDETTQVLIVGGSLVGLSAALFLSTYKIPVLLVERHPGTAIHPRVAGLSARTLELFRSMGAEAAIRLVEPPLLENSTVPVVESLVGEQLDLLEEDIGLIVSNASPIRGSMVAQDVLEPVLRHCAEQEGADLRYGTELLGFEQDEEGVTAQILDRESATYRSVRASYLLAADGNQSKIREQLGITRHGAGVLFHIISIIFTADIMKFFHERHAVMCLVGNETVPMGFLVPYAGSSARTDLFRLDMAYDPEEESLEDYPPERCLEFVRAAIGRTDIPVQIKTVLTYDLSAFVADRWRQGRVFLVGDAARVQPPTGGLGGNTGIAEAHNLAWKLAAVLKGEASPDLLATYEEERKPVADLTVEQVTLLSQQRNSGSDAITVDSLEINMGYRYVSGAIVAEGGEGTPLLQQPLQWTGQPGTHARHLTLERAGEQISLLDLLGHSWVMLVGKGGQFWYEAAQQRASQERLSLQIYQIGRDLIDSDSGFSSAYGVGESGAVLIRPDSFVAWRATGTPTTQEAAVQTFDSVAKQLFFH